MTSQNEDNTLSDVTGLEPSQESQGIDTTNVQKMLEQHKQNLKQRRRQRQEAIIAAHEARVEKLNKACERAKAKHKETVRAIQRPKLQHLLQLINKKRELQTKIEKCLSQKEAAFMSTAYKFQLAMDARSATIW